MSHDNCGALNETKSLILQSANKSAQLEIISGHSGTSRLAIISHAGKTSSITLDVLDGPSYEIKHEDDMLKFQSGEADLLSIDKNSSQMFIHSDLTVNGSSLFHKEVFIQGHNTPAELTLSSPTGAVMNITSETEAASLIVQSGGSNSASLFIASPSGQTPKLTLKTGASTMNMEHNNQKGSFVINDGTHTLFETHSQSGNTAVRGNITVGMGPGSKAVHVTSMDSDALIMVKSGPSGDSKAVLTAGIDQVAQLALGDASGQEVRFIHNGAEQTFAIERNQVPLWHIGQNGTQYKTTITGSITAKDATIEGDMTIGGPGTTGPRSMVVESTNASALINIQSDRSHSTLNIEAGYKHDAVLNLGGIKMLHSGSSNNFEIRGPQQRLLSVQPETGDVSVAGNLTVGVGGSQGTTAINMISSSDATFHLQASEGEASLQLKSGAGQLAKISLVNAGAMGLPDKSFHMLVHGTTNKFSINNGTKDLFDIDGPTGEVNIPGQLSIAQDMNIGGDLRIGGNDATTPRHLTLESQNTATMSLQSESSSSTLKLSSGSGQNTTLRLGDHSFVSSASNGLTIATSSSQQLMQLKDTEMKVSTGTFTVGGPNSGDASVQLQSSQGPKFSFTHQHSTGKLVIKSNELEIMTMNSSDIDIWGSVSVYGSLSVSQNLTVGNLHVNGTLQRACGGLDNSARWAENNHCYRMITEKATFQSAQRKCESWGGYLASIKNDKETQFIKSTMMPRAGGDFYIGYTDALDQSKYVWVSGEVAVLNNTHLYTNWENEAGLDAIGERNCVVLYTAQEDRGASYRGHVSQTVSGRTCRDWDSDTPHGYIFNPTSFPDQGIGNHNYCRNPDNRPDGAFCVTTDPSVQTEACDVTSYWRDVSCLSEKEFLCERNF